MPDKGKQTYSDGLSLRLWSMLISIIKLVLLAIVLLLIYFPIREDIHAFFDQDRMSDEELEAYTQERMRHIAQDDDRIVDGIHVRTGLAFDANLDIVIASCTSCHSANLITQNRATRQGWKDMIVWMQETQALPDLGMNEPPILDYLAKHYAPKETGRRAQLDMEAISWYVLDLPDNK